jgi:cytochrome c biogenesis protein CcmG/thiol:disulfide interchange protein DsbE
VVRLHAGDPSRLPSALIGRPAPGFALASLEGLQADGRPVSGLSQADLKGRVTIVNVWASWCAPCRQEHPLLMDLARTGAARVVGINYKDNPENARRFLGALGNPFAAVGVDPNGRAAIDWGVYGCPRPSSSGPTAPSATSMWGRSPPRPCRASRRPSGAPAAEPGRSSSPRGRA